MSENVVDAINDCTIYDALLMANIQIQNDIVYYIIYYNIILQQTTDRNCKLCFYKI